MPEKPPYKRELPWFQTLFFFLYHLPQPSIQISSPSMLSGILSILTSKPKGMPCHFSPAIPFLSKSSSAPFTISLATLNIQPAPLPKQRIPSKYLQAASPKKAHLLSSCNRKPFSHTLLAASTNGLTQLPLYTTLQLPSSTVFSFFC